MQRTMGLALNKFDPMPNSLREIAGQNTPRSEIVVNLANLYHHYYHGTYGRSPPNPDPAHFEFAGELLAGDEMRLRGGGFGAFTEARRNRSNDMGHAFCRWFLHDHANITYFAHIGKILGHEMHRAFEGLRIERTATGDTPDFFCAESSTRVFLAEAKGSHSKLTFKSSKFTTWRKQFTRVTVRDASGTERKLKGFIVAAQLASEAKPSMKSVLFAEDPESPGEEPLSADDAPRLGRMIVSLHYSGIAEKLNQPVLAAALAGDYAIPEDYLIQTVVWTSREPALQGRRFVGGYYPGPDGVRPIVDDQDRISFRAADPFRLDTGRGTFVGVEEKIFARVAAVARGSTALAAEIPRFGEIPPLFSAISLLQDGSILGPVEFFIPTAFQTF
jgi:hypothetical protein